jgi:hypothetical protein
MKDVETVKSSPPAMAHQALASRHAFDDLDRFLVAAAIEIGRVADDVGGALVILAYYADGHDCGITPTDMMTLMECSASHYREGLEIVDASGITVPVGWRLS